MRENIDNRNVEKDRKSSGENDTSFSVAKNSQIG